MDNQSPGVFYFGAKMKQCSKCKEWKEENEFYNKKSQCKQCIIERIRQYRQTEHGKEATKNYNKSENRKIAYTRYNNSDKFTKTHKKYTKSDKSKNNIKQFWINNPEKYKAGNVVRNAVRKGKIPSPLTLMCHYCFGPATGYHHYKGYDKEHRLDVIPLCDKCHRKADKTRRNNQIQPELHNLSPLE